MASYSALQTSTPLTQPCTPPSSPPFPLKATAILLWPCDPEAPDDTVIIHSSQEEGEIWAENLHLSVSSDSKESIAQIRPVNASKNCCCEIV